MAKCKYPNEVCANMTILNGRAYCDSTPCSLKNELPKQTNADRIRAFSDEELAEFLEEFEACDVCKYLDNNRCTFENPCVHEFASAMIYDWLQSEVKGSDV